MARWRSQSGQSIAELALAMPVLSLILFALAEFGIALNNQVAIANAARDGARVAAADTAADANQTSNIQTAVSHAQQPLIGCSPNSSSPAITSSANAAGGTQTSAWTVTVTCTYTPTTPLGSLFAFFGSSTGSTYQISASSTMRDTACLRPSCYP